MGPCKEEWGPEGSGPREGGCFSEHIGLWLPDSLCSEWGSCISPGMSPLGRGLACRRACFFTSCRCLLVVPSSERPSLSPSLTVMPPSPSSSFSLFYRRHLNTTQHVIYICTFLFLTVSVLLLEGKPHEGRHFSVSFSALDPMLSPGPETH